MRNHGAFVLRFGGREKLLYLLERAKEEKVLYNIIESLLKSIFQRGIECITHVVL